MHARLLTEARAKRQTTWITSKREIGLPQGRGLGLQGWPGLRRGWVGLRKVGGSGVGDDGDEPEIDRDPQGCGTGEGNGVEEEE